jgi:hypothetical protein
MKVSVAWVRPLQAGRIDATDPFCDGARRGAFTRQVIAPRPLPGKVRARALPGPCSFTHTIVAETKKDDAAWIEIKTSSCKGE